MDEEKLLFFCFLCGLLGIMLLFASARLEEARELEISELRKEFLGKQVSVTGKAVSAIQRETGLFIKLCKKNCTNVFVFPRIAKELLEKNISSKEIKGKRISVKGVYTKYGNDFEIIVQKPNGIELID